MDIFISSRISTYWLEKLSPYFEHMDHYEWSEKGLLSPEDFRDRSKNAHVIITESDMISNETLLQNPNLFAIADFRGTVINIDVKLATELGIVIMNTPGRNADAVADLTIAFMIMASRKVIPAIKAMKQDYGLKRGNIGCITRIRDMIFLEKQLD
jgi:phosphoglycerate dehydrogenase-like enzyme